MESRRRTVSLDTLARHVHAFKEAIIEQWQHQIAGEPRANTTAQGLSQPVLRDYLPHLLDEIGLSLSGAATPEVESAGQNHGRQQWTVGGDIGEVLRELSILREQ